MHASPARKSLLTIAIAAAAMGLAFTGSARAQGTTGPLVSDSKVGYIDSAIPGDLVRFRYDPTYNNRRPSRAEFFYAPTRPAGPGLPRPEVSIDYQDITTYGEVRIMPQLSVFAELPVRFLNPDINENHAGLSDINAGFKYAVLLNSCEAMSLVLRTYAPTGQADHGLGTRHVSIEPGLLYYRALNDQVRLEGEFRYWAPVGGSDFAGDVLRYGIGINFDTFRNDRLCVTPVAEVVGWSVLDGQVGIVYPSGVVAVQSAAGDTIINSKIGVRFSVGEHVDFYGGWGRPLTGDRWYENVYRFEMRLLF